MFYDFSTKKLRKKDRTFKKIQIFKKKKKRGDNGYGGSASNSSDSLK